MGQTVVFTVSLDDDAVAIEQTDPRPPHHPLRDAAATALRDRRWLLALLAVVALPALAAGVAFAVTRGPWVSTSYLVAAALVLPASGAWAASRRREGEWDERAAAWAMCGAAGAALTLGALPGVLWTSRAEAWGWDRVGPTLAVLALSGAAGAWLGVAVAHRRVPWSAPVAAAVAALLALAPLGIYATLLPTTEVTEQVTGYIFTTRYDMGIPAYVCGKEDVDVTRRHTEDIAWIALASPLAWVIDAPGVEASSLATASPGTSTQALAWVRSTRLGPDAFVGYCYAPTSLGVPTAVREARYGTAPIGSQVAFGAAFLMGAIALYTVSVRRRSPS